MPCSLEEILTLVCRESVETIANGFPEGVDSACSDFTQQGLEFSKGKFNRI
jgi:hypothetical protein